MHDNADPNYDTEASDSQNRLDQLATEIAGLRNELANVKRAGEKNARDFRTAVIVAAVVCCALLVVGTVMAIPPGSNNETAPTDTPAPTTTASTPIASPSSNKPWDDWLPPTTGVARAVTLRVAPWADVLPGRFRSVDNHGCYWRKYRDSGSELSPTRVMFDGGQQDGEIILVLEEGTYVEMFNCNSWHRTPS